MRFFLFPSFADAELTSLQLRVTTIAFYSIVLASLIALPLNIVRDYAAGNIVILVAELIYMVFVAIGVLFMWRNKPLRSVRLCFGIAVLILIIGLIISFGGTRGLGFFYIIAGYSVLYYILGFAGGIAIPIIILAGLFIRSRFGGLNPESILNDPQVLVSYLIVAAVATVLGICSVIYQHLVVGSLYKAAYVDELTGLPNRLRFEHLLDSRIAQFKIDSMGFSVMGLKLMHFSRVNSFQGSGFADGVLAKIGDRLQKASAGNGLVARYTGTVFLVFTELTDFMELEEAGKRLLEVVQQNFIHEGRVMALEAIMTITRYPNDGQDQEMLLSNIMAGFAKMKDRSGLVCFYDEAHHISEMKRFAMVDELRQAIPRNELRLVYHPKLRLADGVFSGAEVLLRWNSQRFGEVPPGVFIPLAEESELIRDITRWVVAAAFKELRSLGKDLVHAINLSPRDLSDPSFNTCLRDLIAASGLDSGRIEFEITEGVMMDENPVIQHTLEVIRSSGCRLAIDDFGTGYSSLSYLHRLRAQNLKIDQSFIMQLNESNPSSPVVDAIISMALSLGLDITAEGVETPFQEAYLRERGCTYCQGWLYAKPLPLENYRTMLEKGYGDR